MNKYNYIPLMLAFSNFTRVYNTKGNMNLIAESFQRKLLVSELKTWLIKNYKYFKPTKKPLEPNNSNNTNENTSNATTNSNL
jgi:hypothetical protein